MEDVSSPFQTRAMDEQLLNAACDNRVTDIRALVAGGGAVDSQNRVGMRATHVAAMYGSSEALAALLELGADVNVVNRYGRTPLHYAAVAKVNAARVCKMLLKAGADTQITDESGARPFELTNVNAMRVLLGGHTLDLHYAVEEGQLKRVNKCLSAGFPAAARDAWGRTPLHLAVSANKLGAAKALLDAGAPIDAVDADAYTPLHVAAVLGRLDAAVFLLQAGANHALRTSATSKTEPKAATPLLLAIKSGEASIVKALLDAGADASAVDAAGISSLQAALEAEAWPLVRLLLSTGADANSGHPLLFVSGSQSNSITEAGRVAVLKLLLEAGADVSRVGAGGFTALAAAARVGHAAVVAALLEAGADASKATAGGLTPLRLARVNKRDNVVALLLAAGAADSAQG